MSQPKLSGSADSRSRNMNPDFTASTNLLSKSSAPEARVWRQLGALSAPSPATEWDQPVDVR